MAKETKLGLIVVLTLLVTFGVVLVRRVYQSSHPSAAATAAEPTTARSPATDSATPTVAKDTVVIAGRPGSEAPGSRYAGVDDAVPHQTNRRRTHTHDHHPRHAPAAGQSAAGQAFLPPEQSDSTRQDMAVLRPAHDYQGHAADVAQQSDSPPVEFQFAGRTAQTSAVQQAPASVGSDDRQQHPGYPAVEPQPIHESNYRQDGVEQQSPSYRDDSYQQSSPYEQSVQPPALPAHGDLRGNYGASAPHMHQQDVNYASHRQQHAHTHQQRAHPAPFQQQPVGQFGGHNQQHQLPLATAEGGVFVVRPNDTFWTIAEALYGSGDYFKALIEHNRQQHPLPDRLSVGDKVLAPPLQELVQNHADLCPKQRRPATGIAVSSGAVARGGREYVIREGDTLYDIARYEMGDATRWVEIYNLNKQLMTADFDYLKPGTRIALPARVRGPIDRTAQQPDRTRLR